MVAAIRPEAGCVLPQLRTTGGHATAVNPAKYSWVDCSARSEAGDRAGQAASTTIHAQRLMDEGPMSG
jgi:hypothetical protein